MFSRPLKVWRTGPSRLMLFRSAELTRIAPMEAPGEKLLLKMWETLTERGIGALLRPWQIRREGTASIEVRKQELLQLAQAEADAAAIRAGYRRLGPGGAVTPSGEGSDSEGSRDASLEIKDSSGLLRFAIDSTIADAVRREVNVAKAILFAEDEIRETSQASQTEPEPSETTVDPDWLYRWRDAASEVSADELRHLWGRVLAGEVKTPGSFSFRTLEFLRNISREEAEAIELLSNYALGDFIFSGNESVLNAAGISFSFLLNLQDLGIISGVGGLPLTITLSSTTPGSYQRGVAVGNQIVLITHTDPEKTLKLSGYVVTRLGKEVFRLGVSNPPEPYLRALGGAAGSQGFDAKIATGFPLPDGRFQYFNAKPLSDPPAAAS